jgi:hypothetical protein
MIIVFILGCRVLLFRDPGDGGDECGWVWVISVPSSGMKGFQLSGPSMGRVKGVVRDDLFSNGDVMDAFICKRFPTKCGVRSVSG